MKGKKQKLLNAARKSTLKTCPFCGMKLSGRRFTIVSVSYECSFDNGNNIYS